MVGVYFSPRLNKAVFEAGHDGIGDFIRSRLPAPVLLAGDFNAKSALWGSSCPNLRGEILEEWAVALGLVCLNEGNVSTCIRACRRHWPDASAGGGSGPKWRPCLTTRIL